MSDDKNELRNDRPEDSAPIDVGHDPSQDAAPRVEDAPDASADEDPVNSQGAPQLPPVEAVPEELPVMIPNMDPERVPTPAEDTYLTPDELPQPGRVYVPNPNMTGNTPIAQEVENGFMFFISGYPLFLPTHISEELARFILDK